MATTARRPAFIVYVCDRHGRPLAGADIEFTLNGQGGFRVPNAQGRGHIENVGVDDELEVQVTYEGKTQRARPGAQQGTWEFKFDVDPNPTVPPWFPIAGVVFTALTFFSLLFLLIGPEIPPGRKMIFNVWIALCVAAASAFLTGSAVAKGTLKIPFMRTPPVKFAAWGGVGVFIVVLILMTALNR
jgi:hypothetical protein